MARCKECGQQVPPAGSSRPFIPQRVCYLCEVPIGRHDKYMFVRIKGGGGTLIRHRHCEDPGAYVLNGENRQPPWLPGDGELSQ